MARQAVCFGVNYPGTAYQLRGCENDAHDWAGLLRSNGFAVRVLTAADGPGDGRPFPARSDLLAAAAGLVDGLSSGDVAFLVFCGHGTWVPDVSGDEADGRDEALVLADVGDDLAGLVLDDELGEIFARVPPAAHLVFVTDCCHSGTAHRLAAGPGGRAAYRRSRFLPPAHLACSGPVVRQVDRADGRPFRRTRGYGRVVHFAACQDHETAMETEVDGVCRGVFSHAAVPLFAQAAAEGLSYADVYAAIRRQLPSWAFPQTPTFSAPAVLRRLRVFG